MGFEMKDCTFGNHPEYDKGFKAGQQRKQAEIDVLREMVKTLIDNTVLSIDDELEDQENNLLGESYKQDSFYCARRDFESNPSFSRFIDDGRIFYDDNIVFGGVYRTNDPMLEMFTGYLNGAWYTHKKKHNL